MIDLIAEKKPGLVRDALDLAIKWGVPNKLFGDFAKRSSKGEAHEMASTTSLDKLFYYCSGYDLPSLWEQFFSIAESSNSDTLKNDLIDALLTFSWRADGHLALDVLINKLNTDELTHVFGLILENARSSEQKTQFLEAMFIKRFASNPPSEGEDPIIDTSRIKLLGQKHPGGHNKLFAILFSALSEETPEQQREISRTLVEVGTFLDIIDYAPESWDDFCQLLFHSASDSQQDWTAFLSLWGNSLVHYIDQSCKNDEIKYTLLAYCVSKQPDLRAQLSAKSHYFLADLKEEATFHDASVYVKNQLEEDSKLFKHLGIASNSSAAQKFKDNAFLRCAALAACRYLEENEFGFFKQHGYSGRKDAQTFLKNLMQMDSDVGLSEVRKESQQWLKGYGFFSFSSNTNDSSRIAFVKDSRLFDEPTVDNTLFKDMSNEDRKTCLKNLFNYNYDSYPSCPDY